MLPTALELKELTRTPSDDATILRAQTLKAIYTAAASVPAVQDSVTTAAISTGSATEQQLISLLNELHAAGFSYTLSATSFTVTWQR